MAVGRGSRTQLDERRVFGETREPPRFNAFEILQSINQLESGVWRKADGGGGRSERAGRSRDGRPAAISAPKKKARNDGGSLLDGEGGLWIQSLCCGDSVDVARAGLGVLGARRRVSGSRSATMVTDDAPRGRLDRSISLIQIRRIDPISVQPA